ncbi:unnamed protein product [Boreogadus saida]
MTETEKERGGRENRKNEREGGWDETNGKNPFVSLVLLTRKLRPGSRDSGPRHEVPPTLRSKKKKKKDGNHQPSKKRHQERPMVTSAQSVQHQTELEMNQEELADTLWGGELRRIRSEFVERVSGPVIKGLVDDLWQQKVFSTEEKDSVFEDQRIRVDRARCLIDMVMRKGERASHVMIDSMKKRDQHLCSTLGLMSSPAGVEQVRNQSAGQNTSGSSGRGSLPESELSGPVDGKSSVPLDRHGSTLGL